MLRVGTPLLIVAIGALGCGRDRSATPSPETPAHEAVDVVARVGDQAIGAGEVAARMASDGVDARTAVESLIDETLLAGEARRRGIALDREGQRAVERVMVRTMLHDFEAELTPESMPEKEVRAEFAAQRKGAESERFEDVEEEIRLGLSQKKRFQKLLSVVRDREADGLVTYDDDGVALLLAMPGLPERAP